MNIDYWILNTVYRPFNGEMKLREQVLKISLLTYWALKKNNLNSNVPLKYGICHKWTHSHKVLEKNYKIKKIGFFMDCFIADFFQLSSSFGEFHR